MMYSAAKKDNAPASLVQVECCDTCAFYRVIPLESGYKRTLCQLTGVKKPVAGMYGCHYLAGQWSQIDAILSLPKSRVSGNLKFPNTVKLGNGFDIANVKNAIDDSIGLPINHIAVKANKGSFVRLGYREGLVAHSARERTRLPFLF